MYGVLTIATILANPMSIYKLKIKIKQTNKKQTLIIRRKFLANKYNLCLNNEKVILKQVSMLTFTYSRDQSDTEGE